MAATALRQRIIERIQNEGAITFADYMRMALYEPGYGYYVAGAAKMGWEGDYFTSSDIGDFFAHCLGRQVRQMWEDLGRPTRFVVLEQGAGREQLARGVRAWAEREDHAFYEALDYRAQDIRGGQDAREGLDEVLRPQVVLSNELLDAFPVHVVEVRDGQLYELYVMAEAGQLREILAEPSEPEVAAYLDAYHVPWRDFGDGWRAEINLDALRWMQRTAALLERGFVLTIDYGDRARALYTRERRDGTLICYFNHQVSEWPLIRPGEQDITAHVNFSALIAEGRRQGLHQRVFTTQGRWLKSMGIFEELERLRAGEFAAADSERASDRGQVALLRWYNARQRVVTLTDPAGMGNFKVLILRK